MKNTVNVTMFVESGCDASDGEYSLSINNFAGALDISSIGGVDDITLIKDAIENNIDFDSLPDEGFVEICLQETGEREDVFWHKFYIILATELHELK